MAAVRGPDTPLAVRNSVTLGVRRNGTGRLASSSPVQEKQNFQPYMQYMHCISL